MYYRTYIELSRKTHSRAQVNALDKMLKTHPQTKLNYTGLVGRRFCFQFNTPELREAFQIEVKMMLEKNYTIQNNL